MLGTEEAAIVGMAIATGPTGILTNTAAAEGAGERGPRVRVNGQVRPYPAVPDKVVRRRFNADYKARHLRKADQVTQPGLIGALLRREGLYSSHVSVWRKQRNGTALAGLVPCQGRKPDPSGEIVAESQSRVRDNANLLRTRRLTERIVGVQKNPPRFWGSNCRRITSWHISIAVAL